MTTKEIKIQKALGLSMQVRDSLIEKYFSEPAYYGNIRRFENLPLEKLIELIAFGFCKLDERQNDSPTTEEFLEFVKKYPNTTVHGYCVHELREDFRMSLEGLEVTVFRELGPYEFKSKKIQKLYAEYADAFYKFCRNANKLVININTGYMYAWWD